MSEPKVDAMRYEGDGPQTRKTYASPRLVRYGNVSQLTQSFGKNGENDGGGVKAFNKTAV